MIGVSFVYALAGLLFAGIAVREAQGSSQSRRRALVWALFSASFLFGDVIGDFANGILVLGLILLAARADRSGAAPTAPAEPPLPAPAGRLFIPALVVPAATLLGTLFLAKTLVFGRPLIDPRQATPISLGLGVVLALGVGVWLLKPRLSEPLDAAAELLSAVGSAALLPQCLAALGVVFALAGVGGALGDLAARYLPLGERGAAVCVFTVGMAGFTILMGNAFAAFPVMAAAIGAPLIVRRFGGDPAVMGSVGMLSGFCGTLLTPMAANFNLVPVGLLRLSDRYAVIKAQAVSAGLLLLANTLILYLFAFRR